MIVNINENIFKTKVLINKNDQRLGMMGKRFNQDFNALLFMMGGKEQCFWMKNCIIPLDIIMIQNNLITTIHDNCPPCIEDECPSYCGDGNIVLEIQGGTCERLGIDVGDFVQYIL